MDIRLAEFDKNIIGYILKFWQNDRIKMMFENKTENQIQAWLDNLNDGKLVDITRCIMFEDKPIGLISLHEKSVDEKGKLNLDIFIQPAFQGKGMAKLAFDKILKIAKDRGFNLITSSCAKSNISSEKLHKKLGFVLVREELNVAGNLMCRWEMNI